MTEEMVAMLIAIGICVILYILVGCVFTAAYYRLRNPVWKLPFAIFWPIVMLMIGLRAALYENYILEIIDYCKEKKERKHEERAKKTPR